MMNLLDLTLATPAENLALDEALLETAEQRQDGCEILRLWEAARPMVVVGRSSKIQVEIDHEACARDSVPVYRRCSGGAAIVTGPGCLMYAVVLSYDLHPELRMIEQAHLYVMKHLLAAVRQLGVDAVCQGACDLTVGANKFSGNSLRCRRSHLLYHGTMLYNFSLEQLSQYLQHPPRQPDYRQDRPHESFVMNLGLESSSLRQAIIDQWPITATMDDWPSELTESLVRDKYSLDSWNLRH